MISAVVLAKNEEDSIARCLDSLKFADELIVINDNSTDRTSEIAKKFGAKVFTRSLNNSFSQQRNYGLKKAACDWVLFVDADEVVSDALRSEIADLDENYNGYFFIRRDFLWGKCLKYGESGGVRLIRLAKKQSGKWVRDVHETWQVEGKIGVFNNHLDHYPHKNLFEFVRKVDVWSSLHARQNMAEGRQGSIFKIVFYPVGKLLNNLIVRKGILDGVEGVVAGLMMSFHSFLSWSKLWLIQRS